jgi:hydrogenase nickel incorporation protein HypA/HybF
MHEYPITRQIIQIAEIHAKRASAEKVTAISLVIGTRSGYVSESSKMHFDTISKGTICENASIHIEHVKPRLRCQTCGETFLRKADFSFTCPCGGEGVPTEIGKEFFIKDIEIVRPSKKQGRMSGMDLNESKDKNL